ncbi:MAG: glycosyltransferase family 39 protein, partial [Gemmatimonadota bacterium]
MKTRGGLLVLVPALGAGLAVRLLGLYQGYPELYGHVDETGVAASVWNFFRAGTLRPTEFTYPALFSYLTAARIWLSAAAGLAPESLTGLTRSIAFLSYVDPAWAALVGRALSALLSTATIGLTYQIGCEIGGRRVGALAAVFLAAAVIPVRQAHMALPDSAMAFFAALCFLFSCQAYRAGRWTSYLGAGVAAGLVLATKHNGAFSALALVAAHLARSRQAGEGLARAWRSPRLWASGVAAAVAAAAASPYLLLAADRYLAVARYQVSSLDFTLVHTTPWWWLVRASVATEFAVGALMWVGLALAVRRRDPHDWLVLAVVAPSFAYIGSWTRESLHYVLHLYPLLLVAAARAVEALAAWLASRWPGGRAPLAGAAPWVAAGLLTVPNA